MTGNRKKIAVAIYHSGQSRKDLKIPENIKSWTKIKNYRIFKVYRDSSKGKILERPGFRSMMEDAHAHKFEIIITPKLSKFGRSLAVLRQITTTLKANSIGLEVLESGFYIDKEWKSLAAVLLDVSLEMFIELQQGKL